MDLGCCFHLLLTHMTHLGLKGEVPLRGVICKTQNSLTIPTLFINSNYGGWWSSPS